MSDKLQSLSNCSDKVKSTFGPSIKMRCLEVRKGSLLPLTLGANQSEREQATLLTSRHSILSNRFHIEQPQSK